MSHIFNNYFIDINDILVDNMFVIIIFKPESLMSIDINTLSKRY